MRYPIKSEFGLYARFRPPVCRVLLPIINAAFLLLSKRKQPGVTVKTVRIPTAGRSRITAHLITPAELPANAPCLLYCHGGGFVMEAATAHYALAADYAKGAACRVLLVRYRLAPRHPFPAPLDDCMAAYGWAFENAAALSVDPTRIAIGGDSAGGCLAAAVLLKSRDRGLPLPCFQMLVYPVLDRRMQTKSMRLFPDTPMWNAVLNKKMWRWYLPAMPADSPAYASPAEAASFSGLPPAYVETAEYDCLRDEGAAYAAALARAGIPVTLNQTEGTMHGFDNVRTSPTVQVCIARRIAALNAAFGGAGKA